jgi:DNA repair protein RecO (recombination protein O)
MPKRFRTDAVVLERRDEGESNRRVTLLTRSHGKIRALARGARRSRRRFAGCLDLFSNIEAELTLGRGDWFQLEETRLLDGHLGIRTDLIAISQAGYLCELVSALTREEDPIEHGFDLLANALSSLDRGSWKAAKVREFEMRLLDIMGLQPCVNECVGCGTVRSTSWRYDFDRSGVLCVECSPGPRYEDIDDETLLLLQRLAAKKVLTKVSRKAQDTLRRILGRVIDQNISGRLKSREFLQRLISEKARH